MRFKRFQISVMNLRTLYDLENKSQRTVIAWLRRRSLLADPLFCGDCNKKMHLVKRTERHIDGYQWRCAKCKKKRSLRCNSIFQCFSKITMVNVLLVMFCWAEDQTRKHTSSILGLSANVVSKLFRKFENICCEYLRRHPIQPFGGPNCVVQCDESKFNYKPKYQRGRRPDEVWVFGVVSTAYTPSRGYYEVVPRRDRATLLPIIDRCLQPGSIVHTDDWAAYSNMHVHLAEKVASHEVVNHSLNFIDPVTGVHTQHIESKWNQLKLKLKERKGIARDELQYFLDERMWREWNGSGDAEEIFVNFFTCIYLCFPNAPI